MSYPVFLGIIDCMHTLAGFFIRVLAWASAAMLVQWPSVYALEVGDPAPDFRLQASDGNTYSLSQFKGKKPVVIAFFPKAFTTG